MKHTSATTTTILALVALVSCHHARASQHGHGNEHHDDHAAQPTPHAASQSSKHHGGHHRFDNPEKWVKRFESAERDAWQKPDAVIQAMALEPSASVADIGAGTGYFAVRLARALKGKVWAVDIEPNMIAFMQQRAEREKLGNLYAVLGATDDPLLPKPVDVVLIVNTYHHFGDRPAYLQKLKHYLKAGARVFNVDFVKADLPMGPPSEMKLARQTVIDEFQAAGFTATKQHDILPHQYILEFALNP